MTANVIVTIATVVPQDFPAGTVGGQTKFSVTGQPDQLVDASVLSATFADVPAGDYTASAERLDSAGATLGTPVTAAFNVPVPPAPVSIDVPASINVTLG